MIVRPTVVFGERNRGNIYNLLRMIAHRRFAMVGRGNNIKSVAYVENVASVLQTCLDASPGLQLFNYVDKPDFTMDELVRLVRAVLKLDTVPYMRVPYSLAYAGAMLFDLIAIVTGRDLAISSLRVKKFCTTTQFAADRISEIPFAPPVTLSEALRRTLEFEFLHGSHGTEEEDILFDSE